MVDSVRLVTGVADSGISAQRLAILNEANWQTEQILAALMRGADAEDDGLRWLVRGLGMRLQQLNNVSMLVCNEDSFDFEAFKAELRNSD